MLGNVDWINPTQTERLVAAAMGPTVSSGEVRTVLEGWINDDRILMKAAEVIRWESRYHRSYLAPWEPEPPLDQIKQLEVPFLFSDIPSGRLNSSRFWPLAELSVLLGQANQHARVVYTGIMLRKSDMERALELSGLYAKSSSVSMERAPAVKAGHPPCDEEILVKADEMKNRGLDGRTIAKEMRLEPGFHNVATTAVRDLIKGRWKATGRPKKTA